MKRVQPFLPALAVAALPMLVSDPFLLHLMTSVAIAAILALGLQFLLGVSGQLSLGQAAFYGVGAYGSALMTGAGVPFLAAVPLAGIAAGVTSLVLIPVTRLRGPYLAVATLGFSIVAYLVFKNEEWLTGGSLGMMGIQRPVLFGERLRDPAYVFWLCAGIALLVHFGLRHIVGSRFGRAALAVRQDEDAARASGIRVTFIKSQCFIISAFVSGLAGALFAHHIRYLGPADFSFWKSIEVLIMVVIGGVGSALGAVIGAAVVVLLPEWLRAVGDYRLLVFGTVVVVLMYFGSGGIAGFLRLLRRPGGPAR